MKKPLSLLILLIMLLSACARNTAEEAPDKSDIQRPPAEAGSPLELTMVTGAENLFACEFVGTQQGCYQSIMNSEKLYANIVYYNCETLQLRHLSGSTKPVNDADNAGWIPSIYGGANIFTDGRFLYVASAGLRHAPSDTVAYPATITRIDFDGGNRKTIAFPGNMELTGNGGVASDGVNLYLPLWIYDEQAETLLSTSLCKVSLETGTYEILESYDANDVDLETYAIRNVYGDNMVIAHHVASAGMNTELSYHLFSLSKKKVVETIDVIDTYGYNQYFEDEKMYYGKPGTREIWVLDLDTMHNEQVLDVSGKLPDTEELLYLDIARVTYDGHLKFRLTNIETDPYKKSLIREYAYDMSTGEITELTLFGAFGSSGDQAPISILAETGDYFLVSVGQEMKSMPFVDENGTQLYWNDFLDNAKLIAKDDYWRSVPHYIDFEDQVFLP